jgi:hypothetical protein
VHHELRNLILSNLVRGDERLAAAAGKVSMGTSEAAEEPLAGGGGTGMSAGL